MKCFVLFISVMIAQCSGDGEHAHDHAHDHEHDHDQEHHASSKEHVHELSSHERDVWEDKGMAFSGASLDHGHDPFSDRRDSELRVPNIIRVVNRASNQLL